MLEIIHMVTKKIIRTNHLNQNVSVQNKDTKASISSSI